MPAMTATNSQKAGLPKSISEHSGFSEEALRPIEEQRDQGDEGEHRLEARLQAPEEAMPGRQLHREAEDEAADQCTVGAADAAEDDGGRSEERRVGEGCRRRW